MPQPPTDAPELDSHERLLREGERLFMASGFAAISTRAICAAARVKQPSLYHHFGSKEGLYLAVIIHWFDGLRAGIEGAIAREPTLREQLLGIAAIFWSGALGEYQATQRDAMHHLPPEDLRAVGQTVRRTIIAPIMALMRHASASGELPAHADPLVLTRLFWALVDGVSGVYQRGDRLPEPTRNTLPIDLFLAGARSLSAEQYAQWPREDTSVFQTPDD